MINDALMAVDFVPKHLLLVLSVSVTDLHCKHFGNDLKTLFTYF